MYYNLFKQALAFCASFPVLWHSGFSLGPLRCSALLVLHWIMEGYTNAKDTLTSFIKQLCLVLWCWWTFFFFCWGVRCDLAAPQWHLETVAGSGHFSHMFCPATVPTAGWPNCSMVSSCEEISISLDLPVELILWPCVILSKAKWFALAWTVQIFFRLTLFGWNVLENHDTVWIARIKKLDLYSGVQTGHNWIFWLTESLAGRMQEQPIKLSFCSVYRKRWTLERTSFAFFPSKSSIFCDE